MICPPLQKFSRGDVVLSKDGKELHWRVWVSPGTRSGPRSALVTVNMVTNVTNVVTIPDDVIMELVMSLDISELHFDLLSL